MMKNEYVFTIMVGEPKIGEGIVLKLSDGRIVRTSRGRLLCVEERRYRHLHPKFYLPHVQNGGVEEVKHGGQLQTGKRYRR